MKTFWIKFGSFALLSTFFWNASCHPHPVTNKALFTVKQQYYKQKVENTPRHSETSTEAVYNPINTVYFGLNKYMVDADARVKLEKFYQEVLVNSTDKSFYVEGHTDTSGSTAYNFLLSRRRADAVVEYLVSLGATEDNLSILPKGELNPVADDQQYPELNRRVVIYEKITN